MIKFDLLGLTILLYEVPYIDVPTLPDTSRVTNKEMEAVRTIQSYLRAKLPPALSKLLTLEKDRRMRAKIRTRYLRVKLRDYHD